MAACADVSTRDAQRPWTFSLRGDVSGRLESVGSGCAGQAGGHAANYPSVRLIARCDRQTAASTAFVTDASPGRREVLVPEKRGWAAAAADPAAALFRASSRADLRTFDSHIDQASVIRDRRARLVRSARVCPRLKDPRRQVGHFASAVSRREMDLAGQLVSA